MDTKELERQIRDVYTTLMYGLLKLKKRIGEIEPGGSVDTVNGKTGNVVLDASDVGAIASTDMGVAYGVATLDDDGKVPSSQMPFMSIVHTFDIATSLWVANTGSDATDFPYVANIATNLYTSSFTPSEVLLLGTDPTDYPTAADETAIGVVDKYVKFTGTSIRLRATSAPATSLTLVVRG